MSWAGLLRPGDEFCAAVRSRRASLTSESGSALRRFFGSWSDRYRRFGTQLSATRIRVRSLGPDEAPDDGIQGLVHWVARDDLLRRGPGGVCHGDGWPVDLWDRFRSRLDRLSGGSVGAQLAEYAASDLDRGVPVVAAWRAWLRGPEDSGDAPRASLGSGWMPVPVRLRTPTGEGTCIVSCSPSPLRFRSLPEALDSPEARRRGVDPIAQAAYYLECQMAQIHGVSFGAGDALADRSFEERAALRALRAAYEQQERRLVEDPARGRLDRFG